MTCNAPPFPTDNAAERGLRDMMGLLALPALWSGRDGATIVQIMCEAVERIVPLRLAYVHAKLNDDQPPIDLVRVDGQRATDDVVREWEQTAPAWPGARYADARAFLADTPLGPLRIVRLSMGYGQYPAHVWFGSSDTNFPHATQLAFLRAAVSLAMTGLQTARADHERDKASRAKDEFLAMLGHELRNPLSPIVTALALIKLKHNGALPHEHTVIERQVEHLKRLVDDLLDVARITRGKLELKKEMVDLHAILLRAVENVGPLMNERRHRLRTDFGSPAPQVLGDALRLTQVFTNLLTNSAKYTDPGGTVDITTQITGEHVVLTVRDNGIGIEPQLLPRLFNMFEQGASTIDRSNGGLGIGLGLVKNFVALHGGTVEAASDGIGCGTTLTVKLPLLRESKALAAPTGEHIAPPALPGMRILVVDDNLDALHMMTSFLLSQQCEVLFTDDPLEALTVAAERAPQAAILDIGLPRMSGYELAARLRAQQPQIKLIALTGYGQSKDREQATLAGFDRHLVKPVDLHELLAALSAPRDFPYPGGNDTLDR